MESNSLLIGTLKHQEMSCHIFIFLIQKYNPCYKLMKWTSWIKLCNLQVCWSKILTKKNKRTTKATRKKKFYNNIITMRCCHPQHAREMETFHQNHHWSTLLQQCLASYFVHKMPSECNKKKWVHTTWFSFPVTSE